MIEIYTDGASRGNPGKAAAGFSIYRKGIQIYKYSKFIGIATNNQAEYAAMLLAITKAKEFDNEAIFHSDSELMIRQLNGIYKIKNVILKEIFLKIKDAEKSFLKIKYQNLPRENEKISFVDMNLNKLLDDVARGAERQKVDW